MNRFFLLASWLLAAVSTNAQLAVSVSPVKVTGSKALVKLELQNAFAEKIESARAVLLSGGARIMQSQGVNPWGIGRGGSRKIDVGGAGRDSGAINSRRTCNHTARIGLA